MSKMKDYSLDHPGEIITATEEWPKENPYEIAKQDSEQRTIAYQKILDKHLDECNGCAFCEI